MRQRRQARSTTPPEDPIVIPSDVEETHSDGDVEITGEHALAPTERRAFARAQRPGFTLYQPNGPVFQPDNTVRTAGLQRFMPAQNARQRFRARHPRRAATHRGHFHNQGFIENVLRGHLFSNYLDNNYDTDSSMTRRVLRDLRARVSSFGNPHSSVFVPVATNDDYITESENDEIPRSIMDEIRRREQDEEDRRIRSRSNVANKMKTTQASKAVIPEDQRGMFSNGLLSNQTSVCILCGVPLAEGIPADFSTSTDVELKRKLVVQDKIISPWQFGRDLTTADKDLSKKVFFGKCGHVYCGRCINNINRHAKQKNKPKGKRKKVDLDKVSVEQLDLNDPEYSAPNRCVAQDCKRLLTGNYFFRELYKARHKGNFQGVEDVELSVAFVDGLELELVVEFAHVDLEVLVGLGVVGDGAVFAELDHLFMVFAETRHVVREQQQTGDVFLVVVDDQLEGSLWRDLEPWEPAFGPP
ncbi:hypothetical protein OGAPHI_000950 [Ogataea philodendri]|uniref:Uncharacterized protein n=1 Tax=Ogataea philodendri TaxID=1378263 RepID=A0A9P8PF69_9ASCO|nr:uncharacterized protein OGAPHI_000950 [Ogataea philodendri]KAH3670435.1 hypothetical protein OGAPHI_000950 [Ogataea philodendri]